MTRFGTSLRELIEKHGWKDKEVIDIQEFAIDSLVLGYALGCGFVIMAIPLLEIIAGV